MRRPLSVPRPTLHWRGAPGTSVPADPRALAGPLDPEVFAIRRALVPHRRPLWLRRIVRRTFWVAAGVLGAELIVWTLARLAPI